MKSFFFYCSNRDCISWPSWLTWLIQTDSANQSVSCSANWAQLEFRTPQWKDQGSFHNSLQAINTPRVRMQRVSPPTWTGVWERARFTRRCKPSNYASSALLTPNSSFSKVTLLFKVARFRAVIGTGVMSWCSCDRGVNLLDHGA